MFMHVYGNPGIRRIYRFTELSGTIINVQYSTVQYITPQYNTVQYSTVHYITPRYTTTYICTDYSEQVWVGILFFYGTGLYTEDVKQIN